MKKNLLFLFAFICSVCVFTACGNDEDESAKIPADQLVGVYDGKLNVYLVNEGQEIPVTEEGGLSKDVTVSKFTDSSITMELKNLSIALSPGGAPTSLGDIKLEDCIVTGVEGNYQFSKTTTMSIGLIGKCEISLSGTVKGNQMTMEIGVVAVDMAGLNVKVLYVGAK